MFNLCILCSCSTVRMIRFNFNSTCGSPTIYLWWDHCPQGSAGHAGQCCDSGVSGSRKPFTSDQLAEERTSSAPIPPSTPPLWWLCAEVRTNAKLLILWKHVHWWGRAKCPLSSWKRISPVQLSDSGVYTCVARSRAGLAELSYDVQVQGTDITYHPPIFPRADICVYHFVFDGMCVYDPQCPQVLTMLNQWSQSQ